MHDTGNIFFHKKFQFSDGETGEKLLIILGNYNNHVVFAKTTSKQHSRGTTYGCQPSDRFSNFYLPIGSCYFKVCTWVCLDEFYEADDSSFFDARMRLDLMHCASLSTDQIRLLQLCALQSLDISEKQEFTILKSLIPIENAS